MSKICVGCGHKAGIMGAITMTTVDGVSRCKECMRIHIENICSATLVTTTPSVDGFRVKRYIDVHSVEVVFGTGMISEFTADIGDFFGGRITDFERKLTAAKEQAFHRLKLDAHRRGGNAVIGIDIDYTEFTSNRIGVVANGTIVELEPISPLAGRPTDKNPDEAPKAVPTPESPRIASPATIAAAGKISKWEDTEQQLIAAGVLEPIR